MRRNLNSPVVKIYHSKLKRVGDSYYKSECPFCDEGILLVRRELHNDFKLSAFDRCVCCAQQVEYLDVSKLRLEESL